MKKDKKKHPRNSGGHSKSDMAALLKRSGIELSGNRLDQLWTYHKLLRRYNPELNLTRIHNFANMVLKLYVDSILPGQMTRLPSPLLDLGTGPGMPGIPLKIAFPETEIILAESRGNRNEFLQTVIDDLDLKGIYVLGHGITPRFGMPVTGVITRAVETIPRTLERIGECLSENGRVIFMKGPGCDPEIEEATDLYAKSFRLIDDIAYVLPHSNHGRRLVIFERIDAPMWGKKEKAETRHRVRNIESEQNDTFKSLKKLLTGRGIKKEQQALIAGSKIVDEVMRTLPGSCIAWISAPGHQPPAHDAPPELEWYQLSQPLFDTLDTSGTDAPLLLVRTPEIKSWKPEDGFAPGCSLLVPFQDPENVGTVIRSAVAFGAGRIILLAESAHPFHPKAIRASGGAVLQAELYQGPSISELPSDLPVVALSGEGETISGYKFPKSFGLLPGVEGAGLPDHFRRKSVAIPISSEVESLNAATAAAIALYAWKQADRE